MKVSNNFIDEWKRSVKSVIRKMYPLMQEKQLDEILNDIIKHNLKDKKVILDNNYIGKKINTTLLKTYEWIKETKPIIGGHGVLYKNQHQVYNPLSKMIAKFSLSRSKFKGKLKFITDKTSYEYKTYDRKQLSEKINNNSIYGTYGNEASFLYNEFTAPSVTGSGQSLISTTEQAFEYFLANNVVFNNINECITYIENICDEKHKLNSSFLKDVSIFKVATNLSKKFYQYRRNPDTVRDYMDIIYPILSSLTQDQLNRVYYKNNLYEFSKHDIILSYLTTIIRETKSFRDPNKIPESSKEYLEILWKYYKEFVFYNKSPIDRIQRLKYNKRKAVITIDTDSNFVNLNPWVNFVYKNIINKDYKCQNKDKNELKFIVVNTMAFVITNMMRDVLNRYGKDANIPKDYRSILNIKNEFYMSRVVLSSKKKRYFSSIRLREGDEIYPEKLDIKGLDFTKSTATEETKERFEKIIKEFILEKDIDLSKLLIAVENFETEIINSLENGEKKYLIPISVKELEAYSDPLRMQGVRAVIAWNLLYPNTSIELPTKTDIVKLTLTDEFELDKLKRKYPEIYNIIEEKILNNKDERISKKGLGVIAIPRNIDKLPEWIIPFIDTDTLAYNVLNKFYPVMSSLGLKTIKTSKKEYFSNIIDL